MRNVQLGQLAPPATLAGAPAPRDEAESGAGMAVDPLRLLGGLRLRRQWVVIGLCAGFACGLLFGIFKAKTRWEVSLQLMKRDTPTSFSIGTDGNPYHPREFTASTLESAAVSRTVLEQVAQKSKPPLTPEFLKLCVKVEEEKKTDFITLTVSGYTSAAATADLANLWAQAVVNFPKDVTTAESREIREALQAQLIRNQAQLKKLDQEALEAPRSEVQLDSYMHSQGDIEMKIDSTQIDIDSLDSEIATLRTELIRQSPLADTLKQARADLEQALARYTEQNPLVLEKREKIAEVEAQMKSDTNAAQTDLSKFAGTEVGNHLYMRIVELENQREALRRQNEEMSKLRERSLEASDEEYGLTDLLRQKQTLETAQVLLLNRLQEMSLFEQNAQEMYLVLAPATTDEVVARGKPLKVAIFSLAGLFAGAGFSVGLVLVAELRNPKLRTPAEAAKATGCTPFVTLPNKGPDGMKSELASKLWLRWSRDRDRDGAARCIWMPVNHPQEEALWQLLLSEARRFIPSLLVIDCGVEPLPALTALPRISGGPDDAALAGLAWNIAAFTHAEMRDAFDSIGRFRAAGREVWLRLDGPVQEPASGLARCVGAHPLILLALDTAPPRFWREQVELLRESVGDLCGVVLLNALPEFSL